jgi:ribonuclease P protein component
MIVRTDKARMSDERFPKRLRLLRPGEFQRVMSERVSATDGVLRMFAAGNELGHPRLGLTASRRSGGAVERNRWKRTVREAFRLAQGDLPDLDIVCVMRKMPTPTLQSMMASLRRLSARAHSKIERRRQGDGQPSQPERHRR